MAVLAACPPRCLSPTWLSCTQASQRRGMLVDAMTALCTLVRLDPGAPQGSAAEEDMLHTAFALVRAQTGQALDHGSIRGQGRGVGSAFPGTAHVVVAASGFAERRHLFLMGEPPDLQQLAQCDWFRFRAS